MLTVSWAFELGHLVNWSDLSTCMKCLLRSKVDRMSCKFAARNLFNGGKRGVKFSNLPWPRFNSAHLFMRASLPAHVRPVHMFVCYVFSCLSGQICIDLFVFVPACMFVSCTLMPHQHPVWGPSGLFCRGSCISQWLGLWGRAGPAVVPSHYT